ncbi:polyprotein P2/P3 [cadicivirus B1]|uniref:Polyprotein P2/P3 n=1 Tax=cadicivirus B1 TaxID=3121209 RepID=A0A291FH43_9PICO|nr:polyprotein P2/P3 [Hedgehog dicipivirus]ATG32105.1 polyprotein P2/P3 [Hedgehog dicipivirus]
MAVLSKMIPSGSLEMFSLFSNPLAKVNTAADSINELAEVLKDSINDDNVRKVNEAITIVHDAANDFKNMTDGSSLDFKTLVDTVSETAKSTKDTLDSVRDFFDNLPNLVSDVVRGATSSLSSWILKIIGAIVLLRESPTKTTLFGVALMLGADHFATVAEGLFKFTVKCVAAALEVPAWIFDRFDSFPKFDELMNWVSGAVHEGPARAAANADANKPKASHRENVVKAASDTNTLVNAAKNVEWIVLKICELIKWIKACLQNFEETPNGFLESSKGKLFTLLEESMEMLDGQKLSKDKIDNGLEFVKKINIAAAKVKDYDTMKIANAAHANLSKANMKYRSALYYERFEPVVIYIHGPPGIGKSLAANRLAKAFCAYFGIDFAENTYCSPPASEFMDGYAGHKIHLIDDLGQDPEGKDWASFCQMVSTTKFLPNMAAVEEKGIPYTSEIIIATANFSDPPPNASRDIGALRRRCKLAVEGRLMTDYILNEKLDVVRAIAPTGDRHPFFGRVDHYINGDAIKFVRKGMEYGCQPVGSYMSMIELFEEAIREYETRKAVFAKLSEDAYHEAPRPIRNRTDSLSSFCSALDNLPSPNPSSNLAAFFEELNAEDEFDYCVYCEELSECCVCETRNSYAESNCIRCGNMVKECVCCKDCGMIVCNCMSYKNTFAAAKEEVIYENTRKIIEDNKSEGIHPYWGEVRALRIMKERAEKPLPRFIDNVRAHAKASRKIVANSRPVKAVKDYYNLAKATVRTLTGKAIEEWNSFGPITKITAAISVVAIIERLTSMLLSLYRYMFPTPTSTAEAAYGDGYMKMWKKEAKRRELTAPVTHEIMPNIYHKVNANTFPIKFLNGDPTLPETTCILMTALGLKGWTYAVNTHALNEVTHIELRNSIVEMSEVQRHDVKRFGGMTDLTLLTFPRRTFTAVKDITGYLRKDTSLPAYHHPGVLLVRGSFTCDVLADNIKNFSRVTTETGEHHNVIMYRAMTTFGYCGAPLLTTNNAESVILGIHMAGNGHGTGFAVPIFHSDIPVMEEGLRTRIGDAKPVFINRKTKIEPSVIHGVFPVNKAPAVMRASDKRMKPEVSEKFDAPDGPLFGKYTGDLKTPFPGLNEGKEIVIARLRKLIPNKLKPLSLHDALNGIPGMDKMDLKQASGYPYNTEGVRRRDLITVDDEGKYVASERLVSDIEECKKKPFPYTTFIKDELRGLSKIEAGKSRLVEAGSLPVVVEGRMIFGNLFALFNTNPGFKTMCAVGCDPDKHWTEFYHPLTQKANVWDYDYTGFDGSIPSCSFDALADILCEFVENEADVRRYIENVKNSRHVYEGGEYLIEGAMPSGCCGTSVFNSIINATLLFSCFTEICPDFDPFEPLLLAYGDDIIIGSDYDLRPSKVAAWMSANTTFKITPADKGTKFNDESDIHMVRFLKRTFVPDTVIPTLIHPVMEEDTFRQSLNWTKDRNTFGDCITNLSSLAWHYGPRYYESWCRVIAEKMLEVGEDYPSFIPYSTHRRNWLRKFEIESGFKMKKNISDFEF